MIPKTELQRKITGLSSKLPVISSKQVTWFRENCFDDLAVRSRNTLFCLECGHFWKDTASMISAIVGCTCPQCSKDLKMCNAYKRGYKSSEYTAVFTTVGDFQVIRMAFISKLFKKKEKASFGFTEVMQHWILPSGKVVTMAMSVNSFSQYYDQWCLDSSMEVRPKFYSSCRRYDIKPYKIYPFKKVLPIIRRNGFKGSFYGLTPHHMFSLLLSDPISETLLKAGQMAMFKHRSCNLDSTFDFWPSMKICLRTGYVIKHATTWIDYLKLLSHFGKSLTSAFYVCPEDLDQAHDRLVKKKRKQDKAIKLKQQREQMETDQKEFISGKQRFLNLLFTDGELIVKPLQSVEDFMIEGDELGHCVYTNSYFDKINSLVLSARIGEKRIETVEFSLKTLEVIQARGLGNKATAYHSRILSLIESNVPQIAKKIGRKSTRVPEPV